MSQLAKKKEDSFDSKYMLIRKWKMKHSLIHSLSFEDLF